MIASRKKVIFVICIMVIIGTAFSGVILHRHVALKRKQEAIVEAERAEQRLIQEAYVRVNYSFLNLAIEPEIMGDRVYEDYGIHQSLPERLADNNPYEIDFRIYLMLRMYYHRVGINLTYEMVIDFFSQEFESDGTLRLYNNGKHPEMEAFVEWMWGGRYGDEVSKYLQNTRIMYLEYIHTRRGQGFPGSIADLSPQMLDALARAEADPDYVLDLTSLQQQGY